MRTCVERVTFYYRELHQIPEMSGAEQETASFIVQELEKMGLVPQRIGETGVFADLVTAPELPWLLLRADMDGLPIRENSGLPFSSCRDGMMHACGHDAHCAMLLAAAYQLKGLRLPQNIRFLFQPAEETTQGASDMLAHGVLPQNLLAAFSFHVWPGVPFGTLATRPGAMMASSDVFRIAFTGESVHCAMRKRKGDSLQAAVQMAAALPEVEKIAQNDGSIVFCGSIHSGTSHNIVPSNSYVYGTMRTYSEEKRAAMRSAIQEASQFCAKENHVTAQLAWEGGCPAVYNDSALVEKLTEIFPELAVHTEKTLAAEDFACYQQHIPGVLLRLGIGETKPLHHASFCIPEGVLPIGVEAWNTIAKNRWDGGVK